jgi:lipopolysaccharide/colanic/teichoic acid biosynthesis glycosyltransferase
MFSTVSETNLRMVPKDALHQRRWSRLGGAARRACDIVAAGSAVVIVFPVMVIIGMLVRLTSPGPAVFAQQRVGLDRKPFVFYKFRTMRVDGDATAHHEMIERELRGEDTSCGGSWKLDCDSRVTKVGVVLRKTSLDELPQLFNVLRGEMTLVGPRPCLSWEADLFPEEFDDRFAVRPGLTGLWQVSGRSTMGTLDMLRLDVQYARHRTLRGDIAILALTVPAVLRRDGAR